MRVLSDGEYEKSLIYMVANMIYPVEKNLLHLYFRWCWKVSQQPSQGRINYNETDRVHAFADFIFQPLLIFGQTRSPDEPVLRESGRHRVGEGGAVCRELPTDNDNFSHSSSTTQHGFKCS